MKISKPSLSFWQIFNMNVGFLGIQYSFGLQQTAINQQRWQDILAEENEDE